MRSGLIGGIVGLALLTGMAYSGTQQERWISLFNGKDLRGWTPKIKGHPLGKNYANTFRVRDGVLAVGYEGYEGDFNDRFGHLFYRHPYSSYILRLEYRFVGEQAKGGPGWAWRNSGVMIHGQPAKTMGKDQDFPVSAEVQLLGGGETGDRPTGNLCTPGTHVVMDGKLVTQHCTNSKSETFRGDQWVQLELEVRGNGVIEHRINGKSVMRYEQVQYDPKDGTAVPLIKDGKLAISGGTISLQSESHPVEFRKIELRPL